jgi:SET domain-containing protein
MPKINNELVTIKKSKIDGLGVFAFDDIPKDTKIADYYGKEMKWKTFKKRYGEYKHNSLHTYPMRRIWKILVAKEEPYKSRNLTNYINEIPGKANCELKLKALYAKRDIKKGEELLLDYPKNYNRFWLNKSKNGGSKKTNCENKCKKMFMDEIKNDTRYKRYESLFSFLGMKYDLEKTANEILDSEDIKKDPVFKDCERECKKNK